MKLLPVFAVLTLGLLCHLGGSALVNANKRDRNTKPYKIVCYTLGWAVNGNRNTGKQFLSSPTLNPNVCTHINYSFARLQNGTITLEDKFFSADQAKLSKMVDFSKVNPTLTRLISIGGASDTGAGSFSAMVSTAASRTKFIASVVDFLKRYSLDGIDIDWEFPAFNGRAEDKTDFSALLAEMSTAFKADGFLISAAVPSSNFYSEIGYDVPSLNRHLDYINIMQYDFYTPPHESSTEVGVTGHNAPLTTTSAAQPECIHDVMDYWVRKGASPGKLILGVPLYGYGYQLVNASLPAAQTVGAKATANSKLDGDYSRLCSLVKQPGWSRHWDEHAQVPFALDGKGGWLSYDDLRSVTLKMKYLVERKFGGSMVWNLDGDDASGHCGEGRFPMMKLQMKMLNNVTVADV